MRGVHIDSPPRIKVEVSHCWNIFNHRVSRPYMWDSADMQYMIIQKNLSETVNLSAFITTYLSSLSVS